MTAKVVTHSCIPLISPWNVYRFNRSSLSEPSVPSSSKLSVPSSPNASDFVQNSSVVGLGFASPWPNSDSDSKLQPDNSTSASSSEPSPARIAAVLSWYFQFTYLDLYVFYMNHCLPKLLNLTHTATMKNEKLLKLVPAKYKATQTIKISTC